jgi:hypothetical protein
MSEIRKAEERAFEIQAHARDTLDGQGTFADAIGCAARTITFPPIQEAGAPRWAATVIVVIEAVDTLLSRLGVRATARDRATVGLVSPIRVLTHAEWVSLGNKNSTSRERASRSREPKRTLAAEDATPQKPCRLDIARNRREVGHLVP